jgi:hypothetical protein
MQMTQGCCARGTQGPRQWPDTCTPSRRTLLFSRMLFVVLRVSEYIMWEMGMRYSHIRVRRLCYNAFAGRSESFSVGDFIIHIHLAGTRVWRVERDIWGNLKTLTQLLRAERQPEIERPTSMSELAAYMRNPRKTRAKEREREMQRTFGKRWERDGTQRRVWANQNAQQKNIIFYIYFSRQQTYCCAEDNLRL